MVEDTHTHMNKSSLGKCLRSITVYRYGTDQWRHVQRTMYILVWSRKLLRFYINRPDARDDVKFDIISSNDMPEECSQQICLRQQFIQRVGLNDPDISTD